MATSDSKTSYSKVACIGAGFGGIGVAASLQRWYSITDVQLFDRSSSCAGTWSNNKYPGCACDIPAALYSFSYEQNPNWTRLLARQPEIKAYLEGVSTKYGLNDKMHFNTEVEKCVWQEETATWKLHLHNIKTDDRWLHESAILFSCAGGLDEPNRNDIPGAESFKGPMFHTARWVPSTDLRDKRVAVVGNGCTGAQLIPSLLEEVGVKSVVQYVRATHWILPPFDFPYPRALTWLFKYIPGTLWLHRLHIFVLAEIPWPGFYTTEAAAKLRKKRQARAEKYMRSTAPEKYHDILIPDWEIGCKRRIFDSGYCQALNRVNMKLTNSPIEEIVPTGIKTRDGVEDVDAIILATGFNVNRHLVPFGIYGKDGVELHEHWEEQGGAGAYGCVSVNGYPNFFMVAGPNTATGHSSVVIAAENTTNLALRVLRPVIEGRAKTVEARKAAEDEWNADIQEACRHRVWTQGGCSSWYVNDNGWVSTMWPHSQLEYWWRVLFPKWPDWEYKTAKGTSYKYYGLDRFFKPLAFLILSGAVVFYLVAARRR